MRNMLFISHASPEDNEFSIWLASRLQMMGYDVWIDKNALLGGEKFWQEIDQILRHRAIKFLLVYSGNILSQNQPGILKDGILKEYSLAESISKKEELKDFIILLNKDHSSYDLFIGVDRLTQIPFYNNWADGLTQLIKKLEKDKIKKSDYQDSFNLADWYENEYITKNGIINRKELYYTNWWPIHNLPKSFYIYQFETEGQASEIYKGSNPYPIAKTANILSTFDPNIKLEIDYKGEIIYLEPKSRYEINIEDIFLKKDRNAFPLKSDIEIYFKYLLNRVFHLLMRKRGLNWHIMANRRNAYFYTKDSLKSSKVAFTYPSFTGEEKKKTKNMIGRYLNLGKWHFAISNRTILNPVLSFSLKTHILFTEDGYNVWKDLGKMHKHRRAKGKNFFNEEWRDMFLAFLNGLKDKDGKIELPLNSEHLLIMKPWTQLYWSDFGYCEPREKERQGILDDFEEIVFEENELLINIAEEIT